MNYDKRLPRRYIIQLCELLGHDANSVSSITIEYDTVSVVYEHSIIDADDDASRRFAYGRGADTRRHRRMAAAERCHHG